MCENDLIKSVMDNLNKNLIDSGMGRVVDIYNESDTLGLDEYSSGVYIVSRGFLDKSDKFMDIKKDKESKKFCEALAKRFAIQPIREYSPLEIEDWVLEQLVRRRVFTRGWMIGFKNKRKAILAIIAKEFSDNL